MKQDGDGARTSRAGGQAAGPRRQQILVAFATMLERDPGGRITTAALAREVGVSEAALYRHFPSKARMFEGLIAFVEETLFTRIARILEETTDPAARVLTIAGLVLSFAERNPGMTRLLTGDALAGETPRLRDRTRQLFDRIETQLRQVLREGETRGQVRLALPVAAASDLVVAVVAGKLAGFARSEFRSAPTANWQDEAAGLQRALFA